MKVLGNRVLIRRVEIPKKSGGLIESIEFNKEPSPVGEVISVGQGVLIPAGQPRAGQYIPIDLKVGDHVWIAKYAGAVYTTPEGERLEFVMADDVLAKVEFRHGVPAGVPVRG